MFYRLCLILYHILNLLVQQLYVLLLLLFLMMYIHLHEIHNILNMNNKLLLYKLLQMNPIDLKCYFLLLLCLNF